jgi:CRISPR/Cas system-associated protein Cas10 (large subunit of type III CRISPR-Cas system)
LNELEVVRTCALLHDIGKLECWANRQPWSKHVSYTYKFVKDCLGEELAFHAMRHHSSASYLNEEKPQTLVEKIICLADNIASGADRREEPSRGPPVPSPPIKLTHVLSKQRVRKKLDERNLAYLSQAIKRKLGNLEKDFTENPRTTYLKIFRVLEGNGLEGKEVSKLRFVPADTREPINDVSLWDHLKLTTAFATCIYLEGWKGYNVNDYEFALISGDADKISSFINESLRLPDLRARSELIKNATERTRMFLSDFLGPECVLFAAGGSFLALCSPKLLESTLEGVKKSFEEATGRRLSITVCHVIKRGDEFLRDFGGVWESSRRQMRLEKGRRLLISERVIDEGVEVCDICKANPWTKEDEQKVLPTVPPRRERLCNSCWELRESSKGVWLDKLKDEKDFVACIRADGDNIGRVLAGRIFKEENKASTPSRISTLSDIIHRACEKEFTRIIEYFKGRLVFAGGDDLLAFTPGNVALEATKQVASKFRAEMAERCTMSAGVAIFHYKLPVYVGVEAAGYLLKRAKDEGKNKIAFAVIGGSGVTLSELKEKIEPRSWDELNTILKIVTSMHTGELAYSQLRRVAKTISKNRDEAEVFIKYQMGRGVISWRDGERFLSYLKTGLFDDAFLIYNLFKSDGDV